jgi:YD repeat-containing protein
MKKWCLSLSAGLAIAFACAFFAPSARAEIFLYDASGRLQRAIQSDGASGSFGYDATGNLTAAAQANPQFLSVGQSALLSLPVTPFANPASTGLTVRADLSALGGSATTALNDSGLSGDVQAGDGVYSVTFAPGAGSP